MPGLRVRAPLLRGLVLARLLLPGLLLPGAAGAFDEAAAMRASQQAIGREVRDVGLVASSGEPMRLADLRGRPLVLSMIYTSCAGICPETTQRLAAAVRVARGALGAGGFTVLSVGFDSAHDTPRALQEFAAAQRVGDAHWILAAGAPGEIATLAHDTGFWFAPGSAIVDHLVQTTLLDGRGRVVLQIYGDEFRPLDLAEPLRKLALGAPVIGAGAPSLLGRVRLLCTVYDARLGRYRTDYTLALSLLIALSTLVALLVIVSRAWRSAARGRAA